MILAASGIPTNQYHLAKKVGLDTAWNGDPKMAARNGLWCISNSDLVPKFSGKRGAPTNVVGLNWGDDYPVDQLPNLEIKIQDAKRWTNIQWHIVLVSATYTRLLDRLGAETIEEYYQAFAELCPSAIPMLCHYPFNNGLGDADRSGLGGRQVDVRRSYEGNLRSMQRVFEHQFHRQWWAWIQLSPHSHYNGDWQFRELHTGVEDKMCDEVYYQMNMLRHHGCSGLGYFCWGPLDGDGIVDKDGEPSRHWETIKEINEEVGK